MKYKQAREEGRLAIIPRWLHQGAVVWFWDSVNCLDERCVDHGKFACPLRADNETSAVVKRCQRVHPVLRQAEIWSLSAHFTPGAVWYIINEYFQIRAEDLEAVFFKSSREALRHKPLEVLF